jgi:hypothetical protein
VKLQPEAGAYIVLVGSGFHSFEVK